MQIWHLSTSPDETARALDGRRLNACVGEAITVYNILQRIRKHGGRYEPDGRPIGYAHHPTVIMWEGCEWLLTAQINAVISERLRRGCDEQRQIVGQVDFECVKPAWWGAPGILTAHRGTLWRKGLYDVVCEQARARYAGLLRLSTTQALAKYGEHIGLALGWHPEHVVNMVFASARLKACGIEPEPNYYDAFKAYQLEPMTYWREQ